MESSGHAGSIESRDGQRGKASGRAPGVEEQVLVERVRLLHRRGRFAHSVTVLNAALVAYAYRSAVPTAACAIWVGYICAVAAARMAATMAYARGMDDAVGARWAARVYTVGAGLNGIGWGGFAAFFLDRGSPTDQIFLAFVVGGMAAGAAATNATYMPAVAAFAVPALLPLVAALAARGDAVHLAMAAMTVSFSMVVAMISRTGGRALAEAIRLRFTNEGLLAEQRRSQAQLVARDRLASIGTLAAGIAHEINNPLAYIKSNLDLVAERLREDARPDEPSSELAVMVDEAREGAERVRKIVRGLKAFSRADEEERTLVDVRSVLETAISMASNEIKHRARLVKEFERVPRVHADESRLVQVFTNLLVNAAQAIPEGRASRNAITVATQRDERGRAAIEVRDTGSGIAELDLARIFEPFFTTKPVGLGTGLGLSVCHGIVSRLGGEIEVESAVGRGTTFRVLLPAARVDDRRPEPTDDPAPAAPPRSRRVLVVDDDPRVGTAVQRALARDHEVTVVDGGPAALALLREGARYDVILCDLMMPTMSGMELHARLSDLDERQADRVVFTTGGAFTPAGREFLDRTPHARIEKPFELRELRALVERFEIARSRPCGPSRQAR